jgi:putative membrane protein
MYSTNRYRYLWIGGIVAVLLLFAVMPVFGGRGEPWMWGMWGPGWGFGWLGLVFRSLFWVALIMLVIGFFRRGRDYYPSDTYSSHSHDDTPLEILKRRYAAGEITREQYAEMRHTLEGSGA